MALSRRPARFESRHSMSSRNNTTITHDKLHLLRAAAARVYINNDQKPSHHYSMEEEVNDNKAAGAVVGGTDPEHGVRLLAAAASEMAQPHHK